VLHRDRRALEDRPDRRESARVDGRTRLDNSIPIGGLARVINFTFQFRCKAAGACALRLELQKSDGTVIEEFATTVDIKP
jgi:hypothetical protein